MLNPAATEFKPTPTKPAQVDTAPNNTSKKNPSTSTNETQQQQHRNKSNIRTNKPKNQKSVSTNVTSKDRSSSHDGNSNTTMNTSSSTQQKDDHSKVSRKNKQSAKQKAPTPALQETQQKKSGRQTQRQRSVPNTATTTTTNIAALPDPSQLELPTSFITIDQTIHPVHVIPGEITLKNTMIHGYDRYIAWIERCLQAYNIVTIVGMDPAISDVLSLVTIIQEKGIGSYHELATFSMDEPSGGRQRQHQISGIQLKLHRN